MAAEAASKTLQGLVTLDDGATVSRAVFHAAGRVLGKSEDELKAFSGEELHRFASDAVIFDRERTAGADGKSSFAATLRDYAGVIQAVCLVGVASAGIAGAEFQRRSNKLSAQQLANNAQTKQSASSCGPPTAQFRPPLQQGIVGG